MFNPFVIWKAGMLEDLQRMGRNYLVSQTNRYAPASFESNEVKPILLTDYEDYSMAKVHFESLNDAFASIVDLKNNKHVERLEKAMKANSGVRFYAAFVMDVSRVEKLMNKRYAEGIRHYISRETDWMVPARDTIRPKLELLFGEFFVTLKYKSETRRFKLSDLEKH